MKIEIFKVIDGIPNITAYEFFSLDELKKQLEEWKKEFRQVNRTDHIIASGRKDMAYERFCTEMDEYLKKYAEG